MTETHTYNLTYANTTFGYSDEIRIYLYLYNNKIYMLSSDNFFYIKKNRGKEQGFK